MDKKTQGKRNRRIGADFERRVRKDLEEKGWIVDRWTNNVGFLDVNPQVIDGVVLDCKMGIVPAKAKWNNFTKSMMMGSGGFPDFIAFTYNQVRIDADLPSFEILETKDSILIKTGLNESLEKGLYPVIIGVECKINGQLDKQEREKCNWLLDNNIFSRILIASKTKEGRKIKINYTEVK